MWERACVNAKLGDGTFWKHPECKNYKIVWSSIHQSWLETKKTLFQGLPFSPIYQRDRSRDTNVFRNAKPIFTLSTHADSEVTAFASMTKEAVLDLVTLRDLAVWFLDDGATIRRTDSNSYRFILCVGNVVGCEEALLRAVQRCTHVDHVGVLRKNNSKASIRNKSLILTKTAAYPILEEARTFVPDEFRYKVDLLGSTTIRKE